MNKFKRKIALFLGGVTGMLSQIAFSSFSFAEDTTTAETECYLEQHIAKPIPEPESIVHNIQTGD